MSNTPTQTPTSGTETPAGFMTGAEPDPTEARIDEAYERAFGTGTQPSQQGGQPGEPDPEPQPEPQPQPSGEGDEGTQDEPQEEGQEPGEGTESPAASSGSEEADLDALFQQRYGRAPTQADRLALMSLADWSAGLTAEQRAAVEYAYSNPDAFQNHIAQQVLGIDPAVLAQQQAQATQTPPAPTPDTDPLAEEYRDDPIYQRLAAMEQTVQRMAQSSIQTQQQQVVAQINAGIQSFQAEHPDVQPHELAALQSAVTQMQILPGFVQGYGNAQAGMQAALNHLYWSTPDLRNRAIQAQMEAESRRQEEHRKRQSKASSVTGTGGNGASRTQAPPQTPNDRWAAVASAIREHQNGEQG